MAGCRNQSLEHVKTLEAKQRCRRGAQRGETVRDDSRLPAGTQLRWVPAYAEAVQAWLAENPFAALPA